MADFTKAIELDPSYAIAYKNRAIAKEAVGDSAGAEADKSRAALLEQSIIK